MSNNPEQRDAKWNPDTQSGTYSDKIHHGEMRKDWDKSPVLNPQPPVLFTLTPVSTPPEKEGWYDLIDPTDNGLQARSLYFKNGFWFKCEDDAIANDQSDRTYTIGLSYLRPISEEKLREVMGDLWQAACNRVFAAEYGVVPNPAPDRETSINNAINKLQNGNV